jgi:predicted  nucleic acid-binding Zn-ribbon protein
LEKAPLKEQISEHRIKLRELEQKGDDASHILTEVISLQSELNSLKNRRDELLNLEP